MDVVLLNGFELETENEQALNGFRLNPVNGFRLNPVNGFRLNPVNGYSLNNYSLNSYSLNAPPTADETELWLRAVLAGDTLAINGLKDWLAKRRANKAERQSQKARRREAGTVKREAKAAGVAEGGTFGQNLLDLGKGFLESKLPMVEDYASAQMDEMFSMDKAGGADAADKLFGLQKETWWHKQDTPVKAAVIGGGVAVLGLIGFMIYKMSKKKKKGGRK